MGSLMSIVSGNNRISESLSSCRISLHNAVHLQNIAIFIYVFNLLSNLKLNAILYSISKVLLFVFIIFFSSISFLFGQFAGGIGTIQDPFQIQNWEQLSKVNQKPNAHYVQIADLDSKSPDYAALAGPLANSGKGWIPVSNFRGKFSGNGYAINDLFINQPQAGNLGLFGNASNSEFSQIKMRNVQVKGNSNVGALLGVAINVKVNACSFTGKVQGKTYVGGLIGVLGNSLISDSYSLGEVSGYQAVGGLVGNAYQTNLLRSFSTGAVSSESEVGGLIGLFQSNSKNKVENCYSLASLRSKQVAGGIIGTMAGGILNNSYFAGQISAEFQAAGLVAKGESNPVINHSFWDSSLVQVSNAHSEEAKSSIQLKSQAFSELSAWDFNGVWAIKKPSAESPMVSYPYLRSIPYDLVGSEPPFNPIPGLENLRVPREWEFPGEKSVTYGDPAFKLGDEYDSFWYPIVYSSSDTSVVKVSGNYAFIKKAGSVRISAKVQDGRSNAKEQVMHVNPALLKIVLDAGLSKVYGQKDPQFLYKAIGFKNQDKIGLLNGAAQRKEGEQVGTYPIAQGTLDAGPNYQIEFTAAEFIISPKDLNVRVDAAQKSFGAADPSFILKVEGLVEGESVSEVLQGKPFREPGEEVGKYHIKQGDLIVSSNYRLLFNGDSLEIVPALLISGEQAAELKTPWSVAPSFPKSAKFLTQGAQWVELPVEWQYQGLDYFKRGSHLIQGKINSQNYELAAGLPVEIKVIILPKAAPQDLLFEANISQIGLVGDLKVIDSIDNQHEIRLPKEALDNAQFEIGNNQLWWSGEAKIKAKSIYYIEVEVEDRDGNILRKKLRLEFKSVETQEESIGVFNSFSPNHDGINDSWMISDQLVEDQFKVVVVDLSGKVVFESHSPEKRWDGTYLGRPMPDGTYYWIFEYAGKVRRGFLNLLRGR